MPSQPSTWIVATIIFGVEIINWTIKNFKRIEKLRKLGEAQTVFENLDFDTPKKYQSKIAFQNPN